MTCDLVMSLLSAYTDGELSQEEMLQVKQHLDACPSCAALLRAYREIDSGLAQLEEVPEGFAHRVMAQIDAEKTPKKRRFAFGGFTALAAVAAVLILCVATGTIQMPRIAKGFAASEDAAAPAAPAAFAPMEEAAPEAAEESIIAGDQDGLYRSVPEAGEALPEETAKYTVTTEAAMTTQENADNDGDSAYSTFDSADSAHTADTGAGAAETPAQTALEAQADVPVEAPAPQPEPSAAANSAPAEDVTQEYAVEQAPTMPLLGASLAAVEAEETPEFDAPAVTLTVRLGDEALPEELSELSFTDLPDGTRCCQLTADEVFTLYYDLIETMPDALDLTDPGDTTLGRVVLAN